MTDAALIPARRVGLARWVQSYWLAVLLLFAALSVLTYALITMGHVALTVSAMTLAAAGLVVGGLTWVAEQQTSYPAEVMAAIAAAADGGLAVTDHRGRLLWSNPGYDLLAPEHITAPLDWIEDTAQKEKFSQDLQGGAQASLSMMVSTRHGADRLLRLDARQTGHLRVWIVRELDVDGLLQDVLHDAQARSAPLLDKVGLGLLVTDQERHVRFMSQNAAAWTGRPAGLVTETLCLDTFLGPVPNTFLAGDGSLLDVEMILEPMSYDQDINLGFAAVIRNLSAERARYVETDSSFDDTLIEDAPFGVALVDQHGKLQAFNTAMAGYTPSRSPKMGDELASYVHSDDRALFARALQTIFQGQRIQAPVELRFNTQPERSGQLLLSPGGIRNPDMAAVYVLDLTQQKSLELQFAQAQKMQAVGQLAGGVAHDFNNLLTAIIGFCDLLLVRHSSNDEAFADVMHIKQNANRAANLVRQLLAFSRQQTLRPKILSITDVLADLSNLLRRLIGEKINLRMVHGRDLGRVRVDQGQLEQVIINLVVNARDAMPNGGSLTITSAAIGINHSDIKTYELTGPQAYVRIDCSDTGHGIAPEYLNKIFDPFFTTKEVGQGTGLGLSTVYGIIRQTGGYVFAESEPGAGANFRIFLPVHDHEEEPVVVVEQNSTSDLTGKGTILLAEDEDAVRLFASRALVNKGYTVLEAASGDEALEVLQSHDGPVDLLISDVIMPGMDGPALVARARQDFPHLRVIFISGYAEDTLREDLGQEEFAFLPKPFTLKQLAEQVKHILS